MTDWNRFLVVDAEPTEVSGGRNRVVLLEGRRLLALPDNGYQLLLAWVAGPRRVVRTPAPMHPDQDVIDTFVNSYLVEAGVPPRPRGFAWYLDLPVGTTPSDVWRAVDPGGAHGSPVDLLRVREAMERGVAALYDAT
ncbi:DUF5956 family protein [Lentzea flava]|uniref:Uncharacterized protein n=1 Tax=Lentzea flava TaxID=103732 RepID=A0ABQ2UWD7_9PSEU|nr:DUF5956 family protein [Lentzea flava]MCP2202137.1 hypothetical protein [Lentzea flava]GGU57254.1 hypothetical protein GCM10010178_57100 [Lentzea flava]